MTRPRKRKNTGNTPGFSVVDPGGNWIRIFQVRGSQNEGESMDKPTSKLAQTLQNAIVLGESKGDHRQAARILDATLARRDDSASIVDRVEALVYRAELALELDDGQRADALLAEVGDMALDDGERQRLTDALECTRAGGCSARRTGATTNGIESLNSRFRQAVRRRGHFPTEQAAMKILYLTVRERRPYRTNPTGRINGWKSVLNTLAITYGDRLNIN